MHLFNIIVGIVLIFASGFMIGNSHHKSTSSEYDEKEYTMCRSDSSNPYKYLNNYNTLFRYVNSVYTDEGVSVSGSSRNNTISISVDLMKVNKKYVIDDKIMFSDSDIKNLTKYNDSTIIVFISYKEYYISHKGVITKFIGVDDPYVKWIYKED